MMTEDQEESSRELEEERQDLAQWLELPDDASWEVINNELIARAEAEERMREAEYFDQKPSVKETIIRKLSPEDRKVLAEYDRLQSDIISADNGDDVEDKRFRLDILARQKKEILNKLDPEDKAQLERAEEEEMASRMGIE